MPYYALTLPHYTRHLAGELEEWCPWARVKPVSFQIPALYMTGSP